MTAAPLQRFAPLLACAGFALAAHAGATPVTVVFTSADGSAIPEAVAFAVPTAPRAPGATPKPAMVDQIDKEFVPFVLPVQVGTPVSFPNRDQIRHHVYSFSAPKPFELKLYSGVPSKPVVFDRVGAVALGCNIHDWMIGYVYVVDTPWFGKSSKTGVVTLDVPPGEYDLRAWHPWQRADVAGRRLRIEGTGEAKVAIRMDLAQPPPRPASR